MSEKRLVSNFLPAAAAENTFASENFNTVLYTGTGTAQRIGGYINKGAVFNGSSSAINLGDTNQFQSDEVSISFWVKAPDSTPSSNMQLIANGNGGTFAEGDLGIVWRTDGKIGYEIGQSSSIYEARHGTTTLSDRTWHHVVITFDSSLGTTIGKLYIDGSEDTTTATYAAGGTFSGDIFIGTLDLQIGKRNISSSEQWFKGTIDQVRIFNKAVSSSEVTTLNGETHTSTTKSTTDIFDDGSGVALYQLDGNANDTGGVSGKYGSAAHFNGSSSYISGLPNIDFGESVSLWFNLNPGIGTGTKGLFSQTADGGTTWVGCGIYYDGTDYNINLYVRASGSYRYMAIQNISIPSGWNHLVFTFDSSSGYSMFLNNSEQTLTTTLSSGAVSTFPTGTTYIGRQYGNNDDFYFDGRIDDVRIYSDKLTSTEVGHIYNNTTASIPTDNLVAYYKLDGDARDETTLPSYDGTATNVKYAYDGTASNVTYQEATKFTPDLVWVKKRSNAASHYLTDSVRGVNKSLYSNLTNSEGTTSGQLTSFDSTGFSVGTNADFNGSGQTFVAWCFNAGTDSAASNTDGVTSGSVTAVTSTVKANTAAGFSICKFTTPSSGKPSWGHGLDSAPELIIVKNAGGTGSWFIYAPSLLGQKELRFTTAAATSYSPDFISVDTSKIDLGSTSFNISGSSAHINYNFHNVDGYQKIGTYTGTGAAGNAVDVGFEPAFVMVKRTDSTSGWLIVDNKRGSGHELYPHSSGAELSSAEGGTYDRLHLEANGFTFTGSAFNESGSTWIYLAIAADPDETTPTVENSFDVVTYAGNSSTQSIETDFKPDFVWLKNRTTTNSHALFDSVRGVPKRLSTNSTGAEVDASTNFNSFDTNGFTLNSASGVNGNGNNYVGWCWKAGDHNDNLPEINDNGTIDSTVSVNDAAGFSIVKWTGDGSSSATVGHGLSSTPELVITKSISEANDWWTAVKDVNGVLQLNSTSAVISSGGTNGAIGKQSTYTSTVFGFLAGSSSVNNANKSGQNYIAYCWYSVSGHSKIGSYSGSGAAGNAQNIGFKPRFVMIKSSNNTSSWYIMDSQRDDFDKYSNTETSSAETSNNIINTTSTGFEFTGSGLNNSNYDWIYMAFK